MTGEHCTTTSLSREAAALACPVNFDYDEFYHAED